MSDLAWKPTFRERIRRHEITILTVLLFVTGTCAVHGWIKALEPRQLIAAPAPIAVQPVHVHEWAKWSEPDIRSDAWYGTRYFQTRICSDCGEADVRMVQVSAGK